MSDARQIGVVRTVDAGARRHRVALGSVPAGSHRWELGAASREDPGSGVPVWVGPSGRLSTVDRLPATPSRRLQTTACWVIDPLRWRGFGHRADRIRSVGRRALDATAAMLGPRADDSSAPPEAWLWRESRDGRLPLYAAIHPVTGDQLLTRDPSEPAALGYDGAALLGYLVSAAPVTGTLERPVARIAWAPRYGEAADGAGDLWRAEIASPAAATSPGGPPLPAFVPAGHFYSPICDPAEITARAEQIWPAEPRAMPGIDWRESAQLELCALFAAQDELPLRRDQSDDESEYWELNDQFGALDARLLAAMLRHRRPARMIEIGSGYSSLISARVNRECLGRTMTFTCVEPFPRQFLIDGVDGISDLRVELVQDTPLELFDELGEGDVLFIDSSHTAKTGSDVVWLFDEVVPRLAPGVAVHLHDIFLPGDYPREWVMQGRGWNEQYLVRAFLAYNGVFRILLGAQFMIQRHRTALLDAFGSIDPKLLPGGSLWFERVAR